MTRRIVVFVDRFFNSYMTPEFNGDKEEFEQFNSVDRCDMTWDEIQKEFMACKNLEEFKETSARVQGYYHSCLFPNAPNQPEPVVEVPSSGVPAADKVITVKAPHIDVTKNPRFQAMFNQYCEQEKAAGRCGVDSCHACPVNQACMTIFDGTGDTEHQEGICPACGSDLDYEDGSLHEIMDDSTKKGWECPVCGTTGDEWCDIVFSHHEDLTKPNGKAFTKKELKGKDLTCGEKCPMCGGEIEFHGDQEIDLETGKTTSVTWHCVSCGTRGTEISDLVFSEHWVDGED